MREPPVAHHFTSGNTSLKNVGTTAHIFFKVGNRFRCWNPLEFGKRNIRSGLRSQSAFSKNTEGS
jgi:hypothetical protein